MRNHQKNANNSGLPAKPRGNNRMTTGKLLRGAAALTLLTLALPAWSAPVAVDTTSPANGFTDLFSATFDGALTACTPSDPAWCSFFNGKPGPFRNIVITPTPTGAINAVPLGITPVPLAGSYLDLTLNPGRTQVTLSGGTIAVPAISLTIQGATVVNAGGAGVVFNSAPQNAALDANGRAEFLVNLAPTIAADFSTFTVITAPPNGSCSGPLCAVIGVLTLDMVRYRLVIDYDPTFTTFTADYIGQTGNASILSIRMDSVVPKITVTDNQAPANDQQVPFGDVTVTDPVTLATRTVTVTNSGGLDLAVGAVALANTLAPPFALANDTCSAASLTPNASCTFNVTFSPAVVGNFSDTLDIPSNAQGTPTVTVAVSGNGVALPVPAIAITDSVAPASDQAIPFGNVTIGASADQTVTVANEGNADLVIGTVGGLAAPFELVNDGCSGQTVAPAGSCTVDVRFSPAAAGATAGSLEIQSNLPLVTVAVSGTGLSLATPDIEVTDNTLPADDLLVPFGNVTEGTTRDRTITVRNTGGLDLLVGAVAGANPLAAPFTVEADACSNQTLAPGGSCIVALRYAPAATGNASDSLDIPSNDPDEATVTVQLNGAGITLGEGGSEPTSPGGGGGFMAIDPATLVLLGAAGLWGWRRRPAR